MARAQTGSTQWSAFRTSPLVPAASIRISFRRSNSTAFMWSEARRVFRSYSPWSREPPYSIAHMASATRSESKTPSPKVLIADDEAAIANGLSAILTDAGYEVEVASDGQKALERLSADRFGVVLADLKMPKLDGIALLKSIRERRITTQM